MKITRLELRGATKHKDTAIDLPDTGLVLITGLNGSGKSSVIECVPWTVWGKSLRGTKLWSGKKGSTKVTIDGVQYTRSQSKLRITWDGAPTFEKDAVAQAELDAKFGNFEHWRRSCVVSSSDASSFSSATDAERKRMLEDVAGTSALESAYRAGLEHQRDLEKQLKEAQWAAQSAESSVQSLNAVLEQCPPEMPDEDYVEVDQAKLSALRESVRKASKDLDDVRRAMQRAKSEGQAAQRKAAEYAAAKDRVHETGACPTCEQPLPNDGATQMATLLATQESAAKTAQHCCRDEYQKAKEEADELAQELEDIRRIEQGLAQKAAAADSVKRAKRAVESANRQREAAVREVDSHKAKAKAELERAAELEDKVHVAKCAVQALSTSGVRAQILDGLIAAVQEEANSWLHTICGEDIELELKSYGEKTDGSRKEQVSFDVHGVGNGQGYKGTSGGERRRIDIAITLALALVAEAAAGREDSTIFLDEVYDALDSVGVPALTDAIKVLAKDRCVVVIAHGDAMRQLGKHTDVHYQVIPTDSKTCTVERQ